MKRTTPNPLLKEIEAFVAETGISSSRLAKEAVHNGDLINRLKRGGRLWPETEELVRDYMRKHRDSLSSAAE